MDTVKKYLDNFFENEYNSSILSFFLILYGAITTTKLPNIVVKLFSNIIFRLVILTLIFYGGNKNPKLSLIIATIYIMTMGMIKNLDNVEKFSDNDMTSDDDTYSDDLKIEEEKKNKCKEYISKIFNLYKETKNDEFIDLGLLWKNYETKKIEVLEKRASIVFLICESIKSLESKKNKLSNLQNAEDNEEQIIELKESIADKEKEIKDIKIELIEYKKSEEEELELLKNEFKDEKARIIRSISTDNSKLNAYKIFQSIEKEKEIFNSICRKTYKLSCKELEENDNQIDNEPKIYLDSGDDQQSDDNLTIEIDDVDEPNTPESDYNDNSDY